MSEEYWEVLVGANGRPYLSSMAALCRGYPTKKEAVEAFRLACKDKADDWKLEAERAKEKVKECKALAKQARELLGRGDR